MGYTEFVVDVQVPSCPLCRFTDDRTEAAVLVEPLDAGDDGSPETLQVTVLGREEDHDAMEEVLEDWAGRTETIRRAEESASFLVEDAHARGFEVVHPVIRDLGGEDVIFQPTIGRDGWMAVRFLAEVEEHPAEFVQACQKALAAEGCDFRLVRFSAFDPETFAGPLEPLTDKQLEVVRVAYSMGYYETPRNCTLRDLAEVFGISKAAVHMRLRSAEEKIIEELV